MSKFNKKSSKLGFALTEVLMAIAVIIVIGIVAYPLYRNAQANAKMTTLSNSLLALDLYVKKTYSGQPFSTVFSGSSNQFIEQFNQSEGYNLPDNSELITIGAAEYNPNGYYMIKLDSSMVDPASCNNFLHTLAGNFDAIFVMSEEANGGGFGGAVQNYIPNNNMTSGIFPYSPTTACASLNLSNQPSYVTDVQIWLMNPIQ
jgi:Tfp pilus assembly major pilin PilA